MILTSLFFLITPAIVLWLCKKFTILDKIGPIILLYGVGILARNFGLLPQNIDTIQEIFTSACIPLAIPLMLFSTNLNGWSPKKALVSLLIGIASITIMIVIGFLVFKNQLLANPMIGEDAAKVTALLSGMYTGGTINLAAIQMMLKVPEDTYILVNSYDIAINFMYLIMILTFGIKLFRYILPNKTNKLKEEAEYVNMDMGDNYGEIFTKKGWKPTLGAIGLAILTAGISAGLSFLFTGKIDMIILILALTTISLVLSKIRTIREIKTSFSAGMYCILIFSLVIASMTNFKEFDFTNGVNILLFMALMIFGSLIVQTLLSKLFKVDADTMVITSVALINSPPFVPMICSSMKNKNVMVSGLTIGIIGYAIGNYYGYLMFLLLTWLS